MAGAINTRRSFRKTTNNANHQIAFLFIGYTIDDRIVKSKGDFDNV